MGGNLSLIRDSLKGADLVCYLEKLTELTHLHYRVNVTALKIFDCPDQSPAYTIIKGKRELFNENKSLCEDVFKRIDFLHVADQQQNPTLRGAQLITSSKVRFILGYPMLNAQQNLKASICLLDEKPREIPPGDLMFLEVISTLF